MGEKFGENELAIVNEISKDPKTTISQLNQIVGISTTAIENNITKLKEKGILKRIGPDKDDIGKLIRKIENLILESKLGEKLGEN